MIKANKVLAVVLSVMLIFTSLVLSASALTYEPTLTTGEIKISTVADKTTVSPGDVVTFQLVIDPGSKSDFCASTSLILYNGDQVTPCDVSGNPTTTNTEFRTFVNSAGEWNNPVATVNFNGPVAALANRFTTEEKDYYTKGIVVAGQAWVANGKTASAGNGWNPVAGEAFLQFQMKVSDSVQPGDEIFVGLHQASFEAGSTNYAIATTRQPNTIYNLTDSMAKITVAGDEESIIAHEKTQIRFRGIGATSTSADYDDEFDVRVLATISVGETDKEVVKANIGQIGFIYYESNEGAFDLQTAKDVVEGKASDADYVRYDIQYLQDLGEGVYRMSCLIDSIPDEDRDNGVTALGFVEYEDEMHYFVAEEVVSFNSLFTQYFPA